jgi:amino acid adenylation domain-containing protein
VASLLPGLTAHQAARTPDATAVIHGPSRVTYAALDARTNRLAHLLRDSGVGLGSLAGVCLPRSPDLVAALLAVWRAGGAYVPLDPDQPPDRLRWMLADTGAQVVLTTSSVADRLPDTGARVLCLDQLEDALRAAPTSPPQADLAPDDRAYVIYTSGSAGRPKGVCITHAGIANRVMWTVRRHVLGGDDRVLQKTTVSFDAAGWEIFAPLVSGGAVVLAPAGADRDPAALLRAVAEHRVTVLQVVPSLLRLLVEEPGWGDCDTLRLLFSAGESLHAETCQRLWERSESQMQVWNTYGPTECAIDVTAYQVDMAQQTGPVPIGRPIDNTRVMVLDPGGEPVPVGAVGELCAGGPGVARGYLRLPGLTAERFVPDPLGPPGSRMYRTGDRARWRRDGALEYLGRLDQQIKINGVRVEPGEVEVALAAHPDVRDAVVTTFGGTDGVPQLTAYLLCRNGEIPRDELRRFLRRTLPEPFVPSIVIHMDAFPLTASGKVDRAALPKPHRAGSADQPGSLPAGQRPFTPPERTVAEVWAGLLDVASVSRNDDFFQLGGTSLVLTRLASRLSAAAGRNVSIQDLFVASTVESQARLIEAPEARIPSVRPVPRGRPLPLSFAQHQLWFLDRMNPGSPEWAAPLLLRLPAQLPPETVREALTVLAERHEILRTRYVSEAGEGRQVVEPPGAVVLRIAEVPTSGELPALLAEELEHGFDLTRGPVWRSLLVRIPGEDHVLFMVVHHIATDGWSSVLLGEDIRELCAAGSAGRTPDLSPLPVQYADFAVWQRRWLTDGILEPQLRFWQKELDGVASPELPADRRRPPVRDARGATVEFTVPSPLADALTDLGRAHGATPFATLLTAFATLIAHRSGEWDVPIGVPTAGRFRPELSGVVGSFLNTLVFRCRLAADLSFGDALDRVQQTSRSAFAYQDMPFERLVDALRPPRDLSRTPLYQVMFNVLEEGMSATGSEDLAALRDAWRVAKTDLTAYLYLTDSGITGIFEYATALFDEATVVALADQFVQLLDLVVADPTAALSVVGDGAAVPRGTIDRRMAEIWAELLDYEVTAGVNQNFFEVGGNSTLALKLVARIQEEFALDLPVRQVFERPTVARLAAAVEEQIRAEVARVTDEQLLVDAASWQESKT